MTCTDNTINSERQSDKARLGAMGENLVVVQLMQRGWDAFNANCSIKNFKSIDVVCLDSSKPESPEKSWKPRTALVQVKTSVQTNIPTGFSINEALYKEKLWEMVKGPYVFVSAKMNKETNNYDFRFFIIPRKLFVELLYESNNYYVNVLHKDGNLVTSAPACISISWLEGSSYFSSRNKVDFGNPIKVTCEDMWEYIWED